MKWPIRITIAALAVWMLYYIPNCHADDTDSAHKTEAPASSAGNEIPPDSVLSESLRQIGADIARMILEKDALGLMKYVDKNIYVTYGGDSYRSYDQIEADLSDTLSAAYCHLFNISCYPWDLDTSIRDYLIEAQAHDLRVIAEVDYIGKAIWGTIVYDWDGKPEDLWVYKFPNPGFVYTDRGWKFGSFFAE